MNFRLVASIPFLLAFAIGSVRISAAETALFNGHDFTGWELITTPSAAIGEACHFQDGGVILLAGQPSGYLATKAPFKNYRLHVEWRWPGKAGNGGVLLHISSGPKDRVWPLCLQVQTKNHNVGDLLPMAGATFAEKLSTPPDAKTPQLNHAAPDSERPVGEWNSCDIECQGDMIQVKVNGVLQNRVFGSSVRSGPIGFQFEGTPYELRNVRIVPVEF